MSRKITNAMKQLWIPTPPKCMMRQTMAQAAKATPAVINHPPITLNTPVTRNTALSRLQALSASEEPIATIKVTYVVESGNFRLVPMVMSILANTRFTAARTTSKAALSSNSTSFLSNRLLIQFIRAFGINFFNHESVAWQLRTMTRAAEELPNISSPSSWRLKSTEVLITFWAFLEVAMAMIITAPAARR